MLRGISAVILMVSASMAQASGFDVQLSGETAQFNFRSDSSTLGYGGADINAGFFYNEDNDFVLNAGVKATGSPASEQPITFGVGAQAYLMSIDGGVGSDASVQAVGVGGEVKFHLPGRMPMAVAGEVYVAPAITTFGDGDGMLDANVRFEIEVMPGTVGYIGARSFQVEPDGGGDDYELDESVHFGFRMTL